MPSAKGSCVCGQFTFEYTGDSYDVVVCNCVPCRKYYNSSSVNVITDKSNFRKLSGDETTASRIGDSGKEVTNHCCSKCLAVVWTDAEAIRPSVIIKAGLFDEASDRDKLKPVAEIYCRNRPKNFPEVPGANHAAGAS